MTNVQLLLNFAKDVATNYDHEGKDECYRSCRVCAAEKVIGQVMGDKADSFLRGPQFGHTAETLEWFKAQGCPIDHLEFGS